MSPANRLEILLLNQPHIARNPACLTIGCPRGSFTEFVSLKKRTGVYFMLFAESHLDLVELFAVFDLLQKSHSDVTLNCGS